MNVFGIDPAAYARINHVRVTSLADSESVTVMTDVTALGNTADKAIARLILALQLDTTSVAEIVGAIRVRPPNTPAGAKGFTAFVATMVDLGVRQGGPSPNQIIPLVPAFRPFLLMSGLGWFLTAFRNPGFTAGSTFSAEVAWLDVHLPPERSPGGSRQRIPARIDELFTLAIQP